MKPPRSACSHHWVSRIRLEGGEGSVGRLRSRRADDMPSGAYATDRQPAINNHRIATLAAGHAELSALSRSQCLTAALRRVNPVIRGSFIGYKPTEQVGRAGAGRHHRDQPAQRQDDKDPSRQRRWKKNLAPSQHTCPNNKSGARRREGTHHADRCRDQLPAKSVSTAAAAVVEGATLSNNAKC